MEGVSKIEGGFRHTRGHSIYNTSQTFIEKFKRLKIQLLNLFGYTVVIHLTFVLTFCLEKQYAICRQNSDVVMYHYLYWCIFFQLSVKSINSNAIIAICNAKYNSKHSLSEYQISVCSVKSKRIQTKL